MRKIKIYEVKSGSAENAQKLLSPDNKHFYWNNAKFLNNDIGDLIFIINRYAKWALYTVISEKDITTNQNRTNQTATFSNLGNTYSVSDPEGVYNIFYRFDVKEKKTIPEDWNWTSQLGQAETYILVEEGKEGEKNRISKIDDLKKIFSEGDSLIILDEAIEFLNTNKQPSNPLKNKTQRSTNSNKTMSILTAIKTKPFILLAGLSGTGKSRLARTLAYKTCSNPKLQENPQKPGNFELIPVRPNWHDSTELMGYISRINGEKYITTSFLKFIAKAWGNLETPFILCLDEMNLAPVEQYFAEYLSIIETRQKTNNDICTDYIYQNQTSKMSIYTFNY